VQGRVLSLKVVVCLSALILGARTGISQQVQPLDPEWLQQMYAEGWQNVQPGVLRRDTGGGQYETFTYGAEGFQWVAQNLQQQVSRFEVAHNASPDEDLAELIDQLKGQILDLEGNIDSAPSAETFNGEALESCSISYGGDAFAGPQSGTQGVTASSSAYFHNDCNYVGNTFATAYAHAIAGTVETIKIQNDPKNGGSWIDSNASASANGSTSCESYAQGSVTVSALSVSYQTPFRQNFNCSLPLTNSVSGTPNYYTHSYSGCALLTWTASASGGTPGYTYDWYIGTAYQGSGSSLTLQYCYTNETVTVRAVARDSAGLTAEASYTSHVEYYDYSNPCNDPYAPGCECGSLPYYDPYICP